MKKKYVIPTQQGFDMEAAIMETMSLNLTDRETRYVESRSTDFFDSTDEEE